MLITEQTKIAALLKQHPDALETIVSLSPDFKKLRNPVLRKLMAGRTSIGMAAKIGGCTPDDFYTALKPLGFEAGPGSVLPEQPKNERHPLPEALKHLEPELLIVLDVRPILAGGEDPLKLIQQKVKELRPGQVLQIINTFEPTPLVALLSRQGFEAYVDQVSQGLVETYFYKPSGAQDSLPEVEINSADGWDELMRQYDGLVEEIDVRHLEMPQPMITILETLEKLPESKALYVHHKRIPVFLLTELKERKFDYRIKEVRDGDVYLLIFKST